MLLNYYCSEELAIYANFIRDILFVMGIKTSASRVVQIY